MSIRKSNNPYYKTIHEDTLFYFDREIVPPPTQWVINLTTECYCECKFCPVHYGQYGANNIDLSIIDKLEGYLPFAKSICFVGPGETLMYKNLKEFLDRVRKTNDHTLMTVTTNGQLLTKDLIDFMIERRITISISVDAATKKVYETIRKGNKWDILLRNIQLIKEEEQKFEKTLYPVLGFVFLLSTSNIHELPKVIKLMAKYDVNYLSVIKIFIPWLGSNLPDMTNEQIELMDRDLTEKIIKESYDLAEKNGIILCGKIVDEITGVKGIWSEVLEDKICYDPWNMITVMVDGKVNVCPHIMYAGRDLKSESLEDIWNGQFFRIIRRNKQNGIIDRFCHRCMSFNEFSSWIKCT